jgi:hypothetical protein
MIQIRLSRVLSAVTLGLLFAAYIAHSYAKWGRLGREAFLTYQAGRFDRFMAPGHPLSVSVFGMLGITIFAAALYEGLATLFSKIAPGSHGKIE